MGVDTVAEGEVDNAIDSSEGDSGLGTVAGKGIKPLTLPPCQDHG